MFFSLLWLTKAASFSESEKWITVFTRKENVGKEDKPLLLRLFSFPTFSFLVAVPEANCQLDAETCHKSYAFSTRGSINDGWPGVPVNSDERFDFKLEGQKNAMKRY